MDKGQEPVRSGERGATAKEYVGLVLVAALIVGALFVALSPTGADVRGAACRAVSDILQMDVECGDGDGEDQTAPVDDSDFEPDKCAVNKSSESTSSVVKIGFIEIGENAGFIVTEYSDGTVTMTATNGGSVGATGGFGADASWGTGSAEARVDFGGGVEFDSGSTWSFEDMEQAEQFRGQLDDYLADQWAMTHPACAYGVCVPRPTTGAEPPPVPSTTFAGIKGTVDVNADLGISATGGAAPLTQGQLKTHGISASISPSADWVTTNDDGNTPDDPSDDTRTYVTDMQLNSELTGQIGLPTGGTGSVLGSSVSIKKDAEGRIIEVKIATTAEVNSGGGGSASGKGKKGDNSGGGSVSGGTTEGDVVVNETTLSLDPESAEDQEVVTDWLGGTGNYEWPGVLPINALDPSQAAPDDPFGQMLFEEATSTSIGYETETDALQFGLNVKFGLALGADFSMASEETSATEATYLGAPRPDGTRPVLDFTECVA